MLIVNTTYLVSETCEEAWKEWVKTKYVPEVIKTNILVQPRLFRLLIEDEPCTKRYALQFEVADFQTLEDWFSRYGTSLQESMNDQFKENALGFTTLMESIDTEQYV